MSGKRMCENTRLTVVSKDKRGNTDNKQNYSVSLPVPFMIFTKVKKPQNKNSVSGRNVNFLKLVVSFNMAKCYKNFIKNVFDTSSCNSILALPHEIRIDSADVF